MKQNTSEISFLNILEWVKISNGMDTILTAFDDKFLQLR